MAVEWVVPVLTPLVASAATAMLAQSVPSTAQPGADWGQLAAVAGVVTAACSGLNAWLSRNMKLAVNERVEAVKGHVDEKVDSVTKQVEQRVEAVKGHVDGSFDRLREELARKDLTEQRFRELERRIQPFEEERRAHLRRAVRRDDEHPGE